MIPTIMMKVEKQKDFHADARAVRAPNRAPRWVVPLVRATALLLDLALILLSFFAAFHFREGSAIYYYPSAGNPGWTRPFIPYAALLPFLIPIRMTLFFYYDLYRVRGEFSFVGEAARVFKATAIGSLLIIGTAFMFRGGVAFRSFSYSRAIFALDFILVFLSVGGVRLFLRTGQALARRRGLNLIPTLVVGRGVEATECIREMRARPELGYRVIGVVNSDGADSSATVFEEVPIIGNLDSLAEAIRDSRANEVIITDPNVPGEKLFDVMIQTGRGRGVEFRIAPTLFSCLPSKTEVDQIGALPMIRLFRSPLSSAARIIKRASDLVIAVVALALLTPVWLAIAILIKIDSHGPIFYRQERVGMDGRVFLCYKFRTMQADADEETHRELYRKNIAGAAEANVGDHGRPVYGKVRDDPRITKVGRLLRRASLDEIPQLLNVVLGDMSVVGPRPPIPYEVENYELWHRKRLDMKPGITGLWQVSGRNRLPFDEMVRLDLYYIENWSLLLDIKIILRTLPVMWRGDDAY